MRTVLLIRHGQTADNRRGAYLGREDVPLCDAGRQGLSPQTPVGLVLSSPLLRCLQTAELLYPGAPIQAMDMLMERDFGAFSGLTHREITALPGYQDWGMDAGRMPFPGGEGEGAFRHRCRRAWEGVVASAAAAHADSCAVITHGGVIMGIMDYLFPGQGFHRWQCGNGCGYRVETGQGCTYQNWDGGTK